MSPMLWELLCLPFSLQQVTSNQLPGLQWTKTEAQPGPYMGVAYNSLTMAHYEVRARNGPIMAGDEPQWFSHCFVLAILLLWKK